VKGGYELDLKADISNLKKTLDEITIQNDTWKKHTNNFLTNATSIREFSKQTLYCRNAFLNIIEIYKT